MRKCCQICRLRQHFLHPCLLFDCFRRLWRSTHIQRLPQPSYQRQLDNTVPPVHTLQLQQPGQQHRGEWGHPCMVLCLGLNVKKQYSQPCLSVSNFHNISRVASGRWGWPAVGPVCWDGPESERYSSRGEDEGPCQRKEEGTTDGLDEKIRALQ